MNSIILAGLVAFSFLSAQAHQNTDNKTMSMSKKSSDIPDRREFPTSKTVSACENFHNYVCNDVENSFELRPDRSSHTFSFSDSFERILTKKKDFFANIEKEKKLSPRTMQIKNFYLACMNESAGVKEEKETVETRVKAVSKIKTIAEFLKFDYQQFQDGKANLLTFDSSANAENPDIYDVYLDVSFMNLPDHSYYEKPELINDYKTLLTDYFKVVHPTMSAEEVKVRVEKMYNMEAEFVQRYPKVAERRQRWSEKRDIAQAKFLTDYPNVKADMYLKKAPKKLNVRVNLPEAFQFYNEYLTEKHLDTLKDIYTYRITSGLMDDAYPDYFAKKFAFGKKHLGGPDSRPVRQERCTMKMMNEFEKEVDEALMKRLFPNFPKQKVVEISEKIRSSILDGINGSTWLSKEAKETAKQKITNCRMQVVAPQNDREWNFNPIQKYSATEPLKNQQKLRMALIKKTIKEMSEPVNKDAWGMGPLTVNAYFNPSENKFVMPMGILQYPFFDDKNTLEENLGAVGAVMGHELGHGIDDQGSRFDEKGRLRMWMSMSDLAEFQKRGERMVSQFEKTGHNGKLTLGENVADLVGLGFAYKAAFKENKGTKEDKQKFFKSWGRVWCEVKREGAIEKQLKTNPHALGWARINEQVKHQPGFQEAFDCKPGQPMVLSEKDRIVIW